jgi:hypothetical protein
VGSRRPGVWWAAVGVVVLAGAGFGATRLLGKRDAPPSSAPAAAQVVRRTAAQAVEKGVEWLRRRQRADGSWGPLNRGFPPTGYDHPAGLTALALYALLDCGVPPDDKTVKKGFAWLHKNHHRPQGSYETSVALLAVCATAERSDSDAREKLTGAMRAWANDLVQHLRRRQIEEKGWGYDSVEGPATGPRARGSTRDGDEGDGDSSSTHLAALALFAADGRGISVNERTWLGVLRFALEHMEESGPVHPRSIHLPGEAADVSPRDWARGTMYTRGASSPRPVAYGSMTACGLASIQMARVVLAKSHPRTFHRDPALADSARQAVCDSAAWLDLHWDRAANPGTPRFHAYWPYAVSIALDLVGAERLGERAWRSELVDEWVARQRDDGSWDTETSVRPRDLLDTCWMLLFLSRAD